MKLSNFYNANLKYGIDAIASDEELATDVQKSLIWLNFLEPPADGKFGPISTAALQEFQEYFNSPEKGFLGPDTAKKLIETSPEKIPQPVLNLGNDLASLILKYMQKKGYYIFTGARKYNLIYVEGMNVDGSLNNDAPNKFNDLRMVIEIVDGTPRILDKWEGTTEPGFHYTKNPMNSNGAARIAFGQYKAWRVGTHYGSGSDPHEALVQVAPISVYRDLNKDGIRTGDKVYIGKFDINQHWGFDYPSNDISYAGAGCLVGRTRAGHREFMAIAKHDKRYQLNQKYLFWTTVIPGDQLGI